MNLNKLEQIATSSVGLSTMDLHAEDRAYIGRTPVWGLAQVEGLQGKSYLLEPSDKLSMKKRKKM